MRYRCRWSWLGRALLCVALSLSASQVYAQAERAEEDEEEAPEAEGLEEPGTAEPRPSPVDEDEVVRPMAAGFRLQEFDKPSGEPLEEKREVPDLDGVEEPTTVGETVSWVPRVVLFPAYFVTDYLIRRPLGFVVENIEEHRVIPRIQDATTFGDATGPKPNGGIAPRLRLDRHMRPAIGLDIYLADALLPGNDWFVGADTDFRENASADGGTKLRFINDRLTLALQGDYRRRADYLLTGIGPNASVEEETRFTGRSVGMRIGGQYRPVIPGFGGGLSVAGSTNRFDCSETEGFRDICGRDHVLGSNDDLLGRGDAGALNHFASGYELISLDGHIYGDARAVRPRPGTGLRGELYGRLGQGLGRASEVQLVRGGSEVATFLDVYNQRVLGLRILAEVTEPIGNDPIPFTELSTLGGAETMRGFLPGTMRGRSALTSTLEYRYPVWSFFDGSVFVEVGNVFGPWFEGFRPELLRGVAGVGFRTIESRNLSADLIFAVGTPQFEDGLGVDFARLSFGTNWGF